MTDIKLITAVDKEIMLDETVIIPKGSEGTIINVMIESGEVSFLLEFDFISDGIIEWYDVNEVEERF